MRKSNKRRQLFLEEGFFFFPPPPVGLPSFSHIGFELIGGEGDEMSVLNRREEKIRFNVPIRKICLGLVVQHDTAQNTY